MGGGATYRLEPGGTAVRRWSLGVADLGEVPTSARKTWSWYPGRVGPYLGCRALAGALDAPGAIRGCVLEAASRRGDDRQAGNHPLPSAWAVGRGVGPPVREGVAQARSRNLRKKPRGG